MHCAAKIAVLLFTIAPFKLGTISHKQAEENTLFMDEIQHRFAVNRHLKNFYLLSSYHNEIIVVLSLKPAMIDEQSSGNSFDCCEKPL